MGNHQIGTTLKVSSSGDALIVTEISHGFGRPGDAALRFNEQTLYLNHLDEPNKVAVTARDGTIITPNSNLLYTIPTGDCYETRRIDHSCFFVFLRKCTNTDTFAAASAAVIRKKNIPQDIRTKLLDALRQGDSKPRSHEKRSSLRSPRVRDGR